MIPKRRPYLILTVLSLLTVHSLTAQSDWQFRKEKDSIRVYSRDTPGSNIKELKITTLVETSLAGALTVINDIDAFPEWIYQCKEGKVLQVISRLEFIYYNLSNFPWPLSDREFVMRSVTRQDPATLEVLCESSALPDYIPENKRYVRIESTVSSWRLRPLPGGWVEVIYQLRSDPGGYLPAWIVNLALDVGPVDSLKKFREMVQRDVYRRMRLPYIRELGE